MDRHFFEHEMRIAIRQANAIAAIDGQVSLRQKLTLADDLYEAMIELEPKVRARRIRLIDTIFGRTCSDRRRNA